MKPLLFCNIKNALFGASACAMIAVSGLYNASTPFVKESIPSSLIDEVEIEVEIEPQSIVQLMPVDEEPVIASGIEEQPTTQSPTTASELPPAPAKTPVNLPKQGDKVTITKNDAHGSANYNGMTRLQYEDAVKYTCPSQREENLFETYRPAMSRLISIGKYSANAPIGHGVPDNGVYSITNFPQSYLEVTWDEYKKYPSRYTGEGEVLVKIDDKIITFYVNWNSLSITWGKQDRSKVSSTTAETADYLCTTWTNYLRSLDSSYKTRCPNN